MNLNPFKKTDKSGTEETISLLEHKKVVHALLLSILQHNIIISDWCAALEQLASKSKNAEVIAFSKNSLLTLKKKLAEELAKLPRQ